eukprot:TRINITY_DN2600_c0_g1_i1.p1 TRINITY_DN2600_c0_g1~~TRINITY_DN2600_c0_g1_i1.p1  ORF type:complete len:593 (-),score=77.92 TRINITY_DN2600_c0_g1_i1:1237-3015(-)
MPFFRMVLPYSSGSLQGVELVGLCEESNNPFLLQPSQIVARAVRENSCRWLSENVSTKQFPDAFNQTILSPAEVEDTILHIYGVGLEMLVSAEFARETVGDLFVIKCALVRAMQLIQHLPEEASRKMCSNFHDCLWEIYNGLCQPESAQPVGPTSFNLWGQGFLKLARSYYVPTGEFCKAEYFECLSKSMEKFNQCLLLYKKLNVDPTQNREQLLDIVDALSGIGYAYLLKARATSDTAAKRQFLIAAKREFNKAEKFHPGANSTYNLASVCALLDQPDEAREWLTLCMKDGTLPKARFLLSDPDMAAIKNLPWFAAFTSAPQGASHNLLGASFLERSVTLTSLQATQQKVTTQASPRRALAHPSVPKPSSSSMPQPKELVTQVLQVRYTDNEELNDAITFDEDLNRLQASLLRDGLSIHTVAVMVLEVGKGKHQEATKEKKHQENRLRLNERIKSFGMKEKRDIPGDGNCQFYAISDQLFDTIEKGDNTRAEIIKWLRNNKDWKLSNGAVLWNFAYDQPWDEFCDELARDGIWGNHLTLVAAAEVFECHIQIISSVEGDNFVTDIMPTKLPQKKILLSHYAEYHYGSLMYC